MKLFRISNYGDLSGIGGWRFSARWHTRGRPVVYCAEHPAGALVEFLVHLAHDLIPDTFQMLTIEADDEVGVSVVNVSDLPGNWQGSTQVSRGVGNRWLAEGTTPLLRVPSAILPDTWNLLINPLHPDAARTLRVIKAQHVPLDGRFIRHG